MHAILTCFRFWTQNYNSKLMSDFAPDLSEQVIFFSFWCAFNSYNCRSHQVKWKYKPNSKWYKIETKIMTLEMRKQIRFDIWIYLMVHKSHVILINIKTYNIIQLFHLYLNFYLVEIGLNWNCYAKRITKILFVIWILFENHYILRYFMCKIGHIEISWIKLL